MIRLDAGCNEKEEPLVLFDDNISSLLRDLDQHQAINLSLWNVKDWLICIIKNRQEEDYYEFSKIIFSKPINILWPL